MIGQCNHLGCAGRPHGLGIKRQLGWTEFNRTCRQKTFCHGAGSVVILQSILHAILMSFYGTGSNRHTSDNLTVRSANRTNSWCRAAKGHRVSRCGRGAGGGEAPRTQGAWINTDRTDGLSALASDYATVGTTDRELLGVALSKTTGLPDPPPVALTVVEPPTTRPVGVKVNGLVMVWFKRTFGVDCTWSAAA